MRSFFTVICTGVRESMAVVQKPEDEKENQTAHAPSFERPCLRHPGSKVVAMVGSKKERKEFTQKWGRLRNSAASSRSKEMGG